jgi:hypothetical protein
MGLIQYGQGVPIFDLGFEILDSPDFRAWRNRIGIHCYPDAHTTAWGLVIQNQPLVRLRQSKIKNPKSN